MSWLKSIPKPTLFISLSIFGLTLAVYLMTIAPTVTFWDCGELIACSYILGVPHPPGSPLYVLIARIFTLLPVGDQIAFRTNLISAIFSSLTAVLAFLLVVKLCRRWNVSSWFADAGGLIAALSLGFSHTFWSNATESEVYALSMFLMLTLLYLTLTWMDHSDSPKGDRLLAFIAYTALLSTAVHMTTYLVMPVIFLLIIWHDREKLKDPRTWITGLVLSLVMFAPTVPTEIFLGGLIVWSIVALVGIRTSAYSGKWVLPLVIALSAIVGYSSQLYIPVRSSQDPAIDENDPDTWQRFKGFLERRQYGDTGMIERSFTRRGQFLNQLGTHPRIGFGGFLKQQYSSPKLWFIPVLLGIYGLIELVRRRAREGISFLILLLVASLGLVWYMNFGDGTIPNQRLEVRDRDYFFTPAFVLFALVIGLGVSGLLEILNKAFHKATPRPAKFYIRALSVVFLLVPVMAFSHNYQRNDRSGNWVAYDFAYNLLNSCDQDAILFTNGDNDTFPLWFMQEVEKVRPDVRVINFSLLNTDWYIRQRKEKFGVPMTLTDRQIQSLRHFISRGKLIRVQDQMLEHILDINSWKYPINFASTVSEENRMYKGRSLDTHLMMRGLVYRLIPQEGKQLVDVEDTERKLLNDFRYRGVGDSDIQLDETSQSMLTNYLTCFFSLADTLAKRGDYDKAMTIALRTKQLASQDWRVYAYLVQLYTKAGQPLLAEEVVKFAPPQVDRQTLYFNMGYTYKLLGKQSEYEETMKRLLQDNPRFQAAYQELFSTYYLQKRRQDLLALLDAWTKNNPQDQQAMSILRSASNPGFDFPDTSAIRKALQP